MPRRNTRAYYTATLLAHVKRVFAEPAHHRMQQRLDHLRSVLPDAAVLRLIDNTKLGEPLWRFDLDVSAVSTEELASAAARIKPARRGRPLGHRLPIENLKLMKRIDAAVDAGEGSVRAVCERIADRHGISAEGLRKQYRRYCKQRSVPI
jgi:hypothetical protein